MRNHADQAHYFVRTILDNYLLFPSLAPVRILSKFIGCSAMCAAYRAMFTYLSLLAPIKIFLWFVKYIKEEKFYDCNEFKMDKDAEYFFECRSFEDDPVHPIFKSECFVILPEYKSSYLTALQNEQNDGQFVSFDSDSTVCVVDNCANIHIWDDIADFISGFYFKVGDNNSTKIFAINGKVNSPVGVEDRNMTSKDDDGIDYEIILKNVLHFPGSPVKILSVAALADQLKDDWDTWILSRRTQSTFTWDSGKF